jgi:outer membrane protein OmpA-like peptidoglycan-associated protein
MAIVLDARKDAVARPDGPNGCYDFGMARSYWWILGAMLVAGSAAGVLATHAAGAEENLPPLQVSIDKSKVDVDGRRLEVKMNRPASHVTIKVFGNTGEVLADETHDFAGKAAGATLVVTWHPSSAEPVARIDVFGHDQHGYYSGVRIVPWSISIPHEEVNFETNQAAILPSEEPKLADSLRKINDAVKEHSELGTIRLFVAGHTDTRGSGEHNLDLSRRRARAIGAWFARRGLKIPIAYEGFGETALLVKTADEVDEPKNRRVDYVLSVEEPRFKTSGRAPSWKGL